MGRSRAYGMGGAKMSRESGNLGQLIYNCARHGINVTDHNQLPSYLTTPIKVDNFVFSANRHSTGISVNVLLAKRMKLLTGRTGTANQRTGSINLFGTGGNGTMLWRKL